MTAKRVIALLAAVALVLGAFVVRRNVIEDDDEDTATDGTTVTEPEREDATALYCITELSGVCTALDESNAGLDITIEDAGVTLDRLAALDDADGAPLWLTIDPFPAMVDAVRPNDPIRFETDPLGASRLAIALPAGDKPAALTAFCQSESLWRCIGDNAGARWSDLGAGSITGTLRPSFGDVNNSALALTSFGSAVASYFGTPDVDRTQFDDASFIAWLRRLSGVSLDGNQRGSTPLGTMAVRQSALDAAATATFEITSIDEAGDEFDANYSEPDMWIQAVIATPAGAAAPDDLAADLTASLTAAGWDPPDAAESAVPSASTLLALQQLWDEAT